ncbi:MAG: hypothetical protein WHS64_00750 [Fervidobacterium sp.]|uniref:Uncharacterized protein n=1 Tax=Fervidobacterium gondwanense DSM 13020 TaxID=1121883 RepID=A0A1M7S781_FERGO|nr:hypothetical protein [Fervidobacterium gondwanense]UXF00902.1 hypothetical protein IB67_04905 [Fervidobacterium riparium]SHN54326.1 hypothetical protein SAMN02745226_00592 [Fervidobacterium gondwanense DSM 13020]
MLFRYLGITSAILLFFQLSLFLFRRLYKYLPKKPKVFIPLLKFLKNAHTYTGIALVVIGFIHGMLILGRIQLHTGWILWFGALIMFISFLFKNRVGKKWIVIHRAMGFVLLMLLAIHYFFPWIL